MSKESSNKSIAATDLVAFLGRSKSVLSSDDYAVAELLVYAVTETSKLLLAERATNKRLRRLFGLAKSEKLSKLIPPQGTAEASGEASGDTQPPETSNVGAESKEPPPPAVSAESKEPPPREGESKPKNGHGRTPASDYSNAIVHPVSHPTLKCGDRCPACERGNLVKLETQPVIVMMSRPPIEAHAFVSEGFECTTCEKRFRPTLPEVARKKFHPSAVSMIANLHYSGGMPMDRLDTLQRDMETPLPASTQWDVLNDAADECEPVFKKLVELAAQRDLLYGDDSTATILSLTGNRREELVANGELEAPDRTGLFVSAIIAATFPPVETDPAPIVLFFTGRNHLGENLDSVLQRRAPDLDAPKTMTDALSRQPKARAVVPCYCLAHARRYFVDELANHPEVCANALKAFAVVFKNDAFTIKMGMNDDERLAYHRKHSGPVLLPLRRELGRLLRKHLVEPNSDLGKAIKYLLRHWRKLTMFLRIPGTPLTNNLAERILKTAIRYRNNSLFYRSERGAYVGDIFMTLIGTARLGGINPFTYLTAILSNPRLVAQNPADWLPSTFKSTLEKLTPSEEAKKAA